MNSAMALSFVVGVLMLFLKTYAYYLTGSAAILSDASESVIHVFAVGFAAYSMWLSLKPADKDHLYGHDKIGFFSAGFEGAMIIIAAVYIFYQSVVKIVTGTAVENIDVGLEFIIGIIVANLSLGIFLIKKGKKHKSIVLEANGKHILTDCWTSIAVLVALVLVKLTGIALFDPCIAIFAACNILRTGTKLIKRSIGGLMDKADMHTHNKIFAIIVEETASRGLEFHQLRHRQSGNRLFIEFHLIFPNNVSLWAAHEAASEIESVLHLSLDVESDILTHLEPKDSHDQTHEKYGLPI